MWFRLATMIEDIGGIASNVLQGVCQKRQAVKGPVVVDRLGEVLDLGVQPMWINANRAKWEWPENVTKKPR